VISVGYKIYCGDFAIPHPAFRHLAEVHSLPARCVFTAPAPSRAHRSGEDLHRTGRMQHNLFHMGSTASGLKPQDAKAAPRRCLARSLT
jgi:hypothetical protein